jgi:CheY-like chemotaxis protein
VLVVEDDADIRETIGELLRAEGYETVLAEDGQQALELLGKVPRPCLVLADLIMPTMDGWELLQALSHDDRFATIPVVLLSGMNDPGVPPEVQVIKKPADSQILLRIVREHCCPARGDQGSVAGKG